MSSLTRYTVPVWVLLGLACNETPLMAPAGSEPAFAISDGAHASGNAHFYFLPPMVSASSFTGAFDPTQTPVVQICELAGPVCQLPLIAQFTMAGGAGSEAVRLDAAAEQYIVNWHTGQFELDVTKTYRIRVQAHDLELGFADVGLVASGRDLANVDPQFVAVVNGRTLPIKFRIEVGAVSCGPEVTVDANNLVLALQAGRLPSGDAGGLGFFQGTQVLFAGGVAYGTSGTDVVVGYATLDDLQHLDLTSPVCSVRRGPDQETFATVQPLPEIAGPPGLVVTQRSLAFGTAPDDDYVLLVYTITNTGFMPVDNLFAGLVMDWDLFFDGGATNDIAFFDPVLQVAEVTERSEPHVVGVAPIVSAPLNYAGYVAPWAPPPNDPTTPAGYFALLSGGIQPAPVGRADVRHVVSLGPATLPAGASRTYTFALVGGVDQADFEANVQAARAMVVVLGF